MPIVSSALSFKYDIKKLSSVCLFHDNIGTYNRRTHSESDKLKKLFRKDSQFDYMIKSENGKGNLFVLSSYIIEQLIGDNSNTFPFSLNMMFDLDGKTSKEQYKIISDKIKHGIDLSRLGQKFEITEEEYISIIDDKFRIYPIKILFDSTYDSFEIPLKITMIDPTLETVIAGETGKKKNQVNEDDSRKYAKKYLKDLVNIV